MTADQEACKKELLKYMSAPELNRKARDVMIAEHCTSGQAYYKLAERRRCLPDR